MGGKQEMEDSELGRDGNSSKDGFLAGWYSMGHMSAEQGLL